MLPFWDVVEYCSGPKSRSFVHILGWDCVYKDSCTCYLGSTEEKGENSCFFGLGDHGGSGGLDDGGVKTAESVDEGVFEFGEGGGAHEKPVGLCGFEIDGGNEGHGIESGMEWRGRAHSGNSDSLIIEENVALGLNGDAI